MESYIVRIYRRNKDTKNEISGTVEKMGKNQQNIFHSSEALIDILADTQEGQCIVEQGDGTSV